MLVVLRKTSRAAAGIASITFCVPASLIDRAASASDFAGRIADQSREVDDGIGVAERPLHRRPVADVGPTKCPLRACAAAAS